MEFCRLTLCQGPEGRTTSNEARNPPEHGCTVTGQDKQGEVENRLCCASLSIEDLLQPCFRNTRSNGAGRPRLAQLLYSVNAMMDEASIAIALDPSCGCAHAPDFVHDCCHINVKTWLPARPGREQTHPATSDTLERQWG